MTIGTLILGTAALVATAYCFAACLRLRSPTEFLLAAFVIAFTEVVVVSLLLSPGHWLTQTGLLSSVYARLARGAPRVARGGTAETAGLRPRVGAVREAIRDPVLAVLAVAVACGLGYVAALVVGTAPNDYDVLWYHLARAAFWKQQHAVSYITGASDYRLNAFPPNAEIADTFTMVLGRSERFTGFVQLASLGATMVAIGGIARRVGLGPRQALFGALVFATLPVVSLQAATALNDLVFCALLACSAYFLLSATPTSLALATVALGLALGTKATAFLALPVLGLLAAFVHPRRRWLTLAGCRCGGGRARLVLVPVQLRRDRPARRQLRQDDRHRQSECGTRTVERRADRPSLPPRDRHRRPVGLRRPGSPALRRRRGARARWRRAALDTGEIAKAARRDARCGAARRHAARDTGRPARTPPRLPEGVDRARPPATRLLRVRQASDAREPVPVVVRAGGFLLALTVDRARLARRSAAEAQRVVVVLALAPVVWIVLQAATTSYSVWDGRYVVFSVALAAAVWGLALRIRPIAWATTAAAVTTLMLALVHYDEKPSGVAVLGGPAPTSVWDMSRSRGALPLVPSGRDRRRRDDRAPRGQGIDDRARHQA